MKATKQAYAPIVKLYSGLIGAHQMWELWQDSMTMFALSISQAVDRRFHEKREQMYKDIAHKYTKEEMQVFPQIFGEIIAQLEADSEQDLLGDLYMHLDLGSHWHGQFFTPYHVCEMIAQTQFPADIPLDAVKPVSCSDCACGGGALLIAAGHTYCKRVLNAGLDGRDYISLYAQDLSQVSAMMCYVQLSLLGFSAKIKIGDSLLHPLLDSDNGEDIWYTPVWFSPVWEVRRLANRLDRLMMRKAE